MTTKPWQDDGQVSPTLEGLFGYALRRATMRLEADLKKTLAPLGLRLITYSALAIIHDFPGLSQNELARKLSVEGANLVQILDALQKADLVERQAAPKDRRVKALYLTEAGKELFMKATNEVIIHDARMTVQLSSQNRAQMVMDLDKIGKG